MVTEQILNKLIASLSSLPGVGKKSALRIGFYLLRLEKKSFDDFIANLLSVRDSITFCESCGSITDKKICDICSSPDRLPNMICVVEKPEDVIFIERTGEIRGKYHVLDGVISPLDGIGPDKIRIRELLQRLKDNPVEELLIATNPTIQGDATASYISTILKDTNIKITRIAHGVTVGSTLEYADQYTLSKAIKSRNTI
jgi:recombination protein RecR